MSLETTSQPIPTTPFRFMIEMAKPHKWWFIGVVGVIIVATTLSQSTSYFFKLIVDAVEAGEPELVFLYGLLFPVAVFIVQMFFRLSGYLGMQSVTRIMKTSSDRISQHTLRHSHGYYVDRFAGSIMTKYGNVVGAMGGVLPELFWTHLTALVSFIVTFLFIFFVDVVAAVIFAALTTVLILFNRRFAPRKRELSRIAADARTKLNGRAVDIFTNIAAVRQYTRIPEEDSGLRNLTELRRETHAKNWMYTERMLIWNGLILMIGGVGMFWSLSVGWQAGRVSTGELVLVLSLVSQITYTLIFIGRAINEVAQAFGEMEEGLEDLLQEHEIVDVPDAEPLVVTDGSIVWSDVTFRYQEDAVFDRFSFRIEPGQRVGLVGRSGAGKSTFVSLLLRQHELDGGAILIDDQDIAQVTQDSLRANIAVVPQEPLLFHRTIRENIAYGKPDATDEEVFAVARKAEAHDFILELPEGYDTLVGERGIKLSGGQKQRVAIARAMLKDAPILLLDEATSALDSESEVAIQHALEVLMEGRTVIAIAHRLSTLRKMDRIVVMENGEVIEDGDHESLARAGGVYERLWNHQAGGFLQD
jgi:ABC-type multidrug transport system fused ATPase/permease subunit